MKYKLLIVVPLISVLFLSFASCRQNNFTSEGQTWGTLYHITYDGSKNCDEAIEATLSTIDNELSMFNPASAVALVNSGTCDTVSEHFKRVFMISRRINTLSGGVYDPTVGPLSDLWGFGPHDTDTEPTEEAIATAIMAVGIAGCSIDSTGRLSRKSPGTVFDFSSIAKGYGIDCVADTLEALGAQNYMIEIGGEVLACGLSPKGRPWRIQIDSPLSGMGHKRLGIIELGPEKTAVASSGNYRNLRRRADGSLYGHTLSPITGHPVEGRIAAATVLASDCATADALATACMASAEPDSALAVLVRAKAEGIIVYVEGDSLYTASTSNFHMVKQ